MTRKYSLVIEGDPTGYSAYVPELSTVLVTGRSVKELAGRAAEAIRVYWESVRIDQTGSDCLVEINVQSRCFELASESKPPRATAVDRHEENSGIVGGDLNVLLI